MKEKVPHAVKDAATIWFLSMLAITVMGCSSGKIYYLENPTNSPITAPITYIEIPGAKEYQGFATLEQIVIYGDGDFDDLSKTIVHETKHLEQIQQVGGTIPYWIVYGLNSEQACKWEKEAGASGHQVCDQAEQEVALK